MGFRICLPLSDGSEVCFDIPVLIQEFNPIPDPGPLKDLSVLVSIHELARQLQDEGLQKSVLATATDGIDAFSAQLPSGVMLHQEGQAFARA